MQSSIFNFQFAIAGRQALLAAAIFHVAVTATVLGVGKSGVFPQQFDQYGIGEFALDGHKYRVQADAAADTLLHTGPKAWLEYPAQIHIKVYAVCFATLRPILGANILAAEPINLFCYLSILVLTFALAREIGGQKSAWIAATMTALWPSFLLHTTQLLRDPLVVAAMLALMLVVTCWLTREYSWREGLITGAVAVAAALLQFVMRLEIQFWIAVVASCVAVLLLIRLISRRILLPGNVVGVVMLVCLALSLPRMAAAINARRAATGAEELTTGFLEKMPPQLRIMITDSGKAPTLWGMIAIRRYISADTAGSSDIDAGVEFRSQGDIIRYLPRATEIGFFAPFPSMWFVSGKKVGQAGRLLAGGETLILYAVEVLAFIGLWQKRWCLSVWLLAIAAAIGVIGLGLVVVNLGTLYRMRYPFSILLVILAATLIGRQSSSGDTRASKPVEVH